MFIQAMLDATFLDRLRGNSDFCTLSDEPARANSFLARHQFLHFRLLQGAVLPGLPSM